MEKKEILYFEADDASKMGLNGKQVFFTKRINGKTTHNKLSDEENNTLNKYNINQNNITKEEDDLFIEFKNPYYEEQKKKNINKKKANNPKKKVQQKKNNKKQTKKEKQRKKRKKIIKIFLILVLIIGIIIFALVSPTFNIQKIEVKGNEKISSSTIISLSNLQEGKNIFQNVKKDIINNIKENTYINSVTVKRKLPGTIEITVEERNVAYQVKAINSYVYIDYQGNILEIASQKEKVPIVEGFTTSQDDLLNGKRLSNDDITALNTILKIMESAKNVEISDLISKIIILNQKEYILELNSESKQIYLGDATDLTNRMLYANVILEKEKGKSGKVFINGNLNDGFKPYFREEQIN